MNTNNSYPQISFGPEVLSSAEQDALESCKHCDSIIVDEPFAYDEFWEPFCSQDCVESERDRQAEKAFESFCEDFYGGSQPVTLDEQHRAAHEQKRNLR